MSKIKKMTNWKELEKKLEEKKNESEKLFDENELLEHLKQRVKGQDEVLSEVAKTIRINLAKNSRNRPVANLLFWDRQEQEKRS